MKIKILFLTLLISFITPNLFAQSCEDVLNEIDTHFKTQPSRTLMEKLSTENLTNNQRNTLILEYVKLANTTLSRYYQAILLLQNYSNTPDNPKKTKHMLAIKRQIQVLNTRLTILNITSDILKNSLEVNLKIDTEDLNNHFTKLKRPIGILKNLNKAQTLQEYTVNKAEEKELNKKNFLETPYGRDGGKYDFGFLDHAPKETKVQKNSNQKKSFGFIPEQKNTPTSKKQNFIGFLKPKNIDVPYTYEPAYNPSTGRVEIQINGKSKIGFN